MSEHSEEENQAVQVPAPTKPPSVSSLILERMRMMEDCLAELAAVVHVGRNYNTAEMTEIRTQGAQISRAFLYVAITLPILTFVLGCILITVLLR